MSEASHRKASVTAEPAGAAAAEPLRHKVLRDHFLSELLEIIPDMVLVLNSKRQTIAANRQALTTLGKTESLLVGLRPGEILDCVGASETPGGCGAADRCGLCGALQAILASQQTGEQVSREAHMLVGGSRVAALDLLITARPTTLDGLPLTICILRDISDQKRRAILETLFFHDILNAAGGISGLAEILADTNRRLSPEKEKECRFGMARLSRRLIEEICHQRDLLAAESGEFEPRMAEIHVPTVLREVRELYASHPVARNRFFEIGEESAGTIRSDATIVRRVLGNLVKNALEATPEGEAVRTSCRDLGEQVALEVHNPGVMPREVQLQVFQRSFSTKADRGRGIGTYSIKLFVERYLKGTVGFTSADPGGTTFTITLPKEPAAREVAHGL